MIKDIDSIINNLLKSEIFEEKLRDIVIELLPKNELEEENQPISEDITEVNNSTWWSPIKELLENTFSSKDKVISSLKSDIKELKLSNPDKINDKNRLIEELETENNSKDNKISDLKDSKKSLEENLDKVNNELSSVKKEKNKLKADVSTLEDEKKDLENEKTDLEGQNDSLNNELEEFKSDSNLAEHKRLFEKYKDESDVEVSNEFDDFETFVINSGSKEFLKKSYDKFRSSLKQGIVSDIEELFMLYLETVKKIEKDIDIEFIIPNEGDICNTKENDSIKGAGKKIKQVLIAGFKIDGSVKKAIVETLGD